VDAVTARLQKAILGTPDFVEVTIKSEQWEPMEKSIRDWAAWFVNQAGVKARLRTIAFDAPLNGHAFVKPIWVEETRKYHAYDAAGAIATADIPVYTGPLWDVIPPSDIIWPEGFDEWGQLPWYAQRLRYTWQELKDLERRGMYVGVERLKPFNAERDDAVYRARTEAIGAHDVQAQNFYTVYEFTGIVEIPQSDPEAEPLFEEVVLTYHIESRALIQKILNPYFGKARMTLQVPFQAQAHEIDGLGIAEMLYQFQQEASTVHNQVIDAATAANAGIVAVTPDANLGTEEEIYPGKIIRTDKPKEDIAIYRLSEPSPGLLNLESQAHHLGEKRSGMSSYNFGMESPTVGSRATATGTTALINEGNIRTWVSIDDMRTALEELMYLTIQLEQQFRPGGFEYSPGKRIMFPQGDVRTSIGLRLNLTSEKVNRDLELQNLQILMSVLNDYYERLSQASMMVFNPQFPQEAKLVAVQIMIASQNVVKRFAERFELENTDMIVPSIMSILQGAYGGPPQPGTPAMQAGVGGMVGGGALPPAGAPPNGGIAPPDLQASGGNPYAGPM
jgi:hypothetical protein